MIFAISTIVTLGFGSFGSISQIVQLGFGGGSGGGSGSRRLTLVGTDSSSLTMRGGQ